MGCNGRKTDKLLILLWHDPRVHACILAGVGTDPSENVHQEHQADLLKQCVFACDQSVIKHVLLEEHCTFSAVSEIPLEGFSTKFASGTPLKFAANDFSAVVIGQ
jgi:hypothetical protein